ncbi:MAG: hypothetical protein JRF37_11370 [Deltaproteobacteria bacterium]|nr:hypothetical protein [Deltaproteobacteria bacterium]
MAQLNASISDAITIKDRLRFYYYYMAGERESRQDRRKTYKKIWEIARKKDTLSYGWKVQDFFSCILQVPNKN